MVDLGFIYGLLKDGFGKWTKPNVAVIWPLSAIEEEPVFRKLKADGHECKWVKEGNLRKREREGWKRVVQRDSLGRPTVFMDRNKELLLLYK